MVLEFITVHVEDFLFVCVCVSVLLFACVIIVSVKPQLKWTELLIKTKEAEIIKLYNS